jgi:hypothetical protein
LADFDGFADTGSATWAVVPDAAAVDGVVALDEGFELPPHAASGTTTSRAKGRSKRVRTTTSVQILRARSRSGDSVHRVRRLLVFALAGAAATATTLGVGIAPAAAHICPVPAEIPVGEPATIAVGVTVEDATIPDVTIAVPAGLSLDRVDAKPGWTAKRTGSTVRYRGGPIAAFACEYFSLGVTASNRGSFGIPVTLRDAAGKIVARTTPDANSASDRVLDQFVYAGVKPPKPKSGSSAPSLPLIAGIALIAFGVIMFTVLRIRGRRPEIEMPAETDGSETPEELDDTALQARLERFRKRTPDPPPQP